MRGNPGETIAGGLRAMKTLQRVGPRAWCKRCSRYHKRGEACDLYLRRRTKNGRKVWVWAH